MKVSINNCSTFNITLIGKVADRCYIIVDIYVQTVIDNGYYITVTRLDLKLLKGLLWTVMIHSYGELRKLNGCGKVLHYLNERPSLKICMLKVKKLVNNVPTYLTTYTTSIETNVQIKYCINSDLMFDTKLKIFK